MFLLRPRQPTPNATAPMQAPSATAFSAMTGDTISAHPMAAPATLDTAQMMTWRRWFEKERGSREGEVEHGRGG